MDLPQIIRSRLHAVALEETAILSMNVAAGTPLLGVKMEKQRGKNWCWAAVAASLHRFLKPGGPAKSQCGLVQAELKHTDCCNKFPPLEACDKTAALEVVLPEIGIPIEIKATAITFAEVSKQIVKKKPVACLITFSPPAVNHFVQIDGCIDGPVRKYVVNDPRLDAPVTLPAQQLSTYKGGNWRRTFLIK